jgi:ribonuclease BN (tRNA processing enzyme)
MEVLLLGSGGWIPTRRRETCAAFLRQGPHVLLIDAGTGIQRLVERPELLAGAESVDILLTHFHLDHVVGLSYLPALPIADVVTVWGPGELLADIATRAVLERLLSPPLFSAPLNVVAGVVREIPAQEFAVGPFPIATRIQRFHLEPTLALRCGDSFTYCTDTAPDPENVGFAAGSRVLLHEAWYAQVSSDDGNHSAGGDAGRIARQAGVERLVLIHVNPLQESDEELVASAESEFPGARVGVDLAAIPLD